ncbi:MAG: hypothetical protein PF445_02955, partial [Melioribacteraceae bacterium]|nr:hypothetical protein [Melioribacteraceae bacterium]
MQQNLSEDLLDNLFLNAPVGIITVDANLVINNANETSLQFELTSASSVNELIGLKIDVLPLFSSPRIKNDLEELTNGIPFEAELTSKLTLDGNEITVILKASPNLENGLFKGAIFIFEDFKVPLTLTPDKVIENELFNKFVKSISDYFMILNSRGEVIYSPPIGSLKSHNNIFNRKYQSIKQIFNGKYDDIISELFDEAIATKEPISSQSITDDLNTSISFQLNFIPILDELKKVNFIFVLFED